MPCASHPARVYQTQPNLVPSRANISDRILNIAPSRARSPSSATHSPRRRSRPSSARAFVRPIAERRHPERAAAADCRTLPVSTRPALPCQGRPAAILLAGPRQCGKTTLARSLLDSRGQYLNWDITKDRKVIRELAWPKDASLVVLDELHKAPTWKNLLKGVIDEFGNEPPLLVTGSARLDAFRGGGDALTGRHYFYRLHPIDPAESKLFLPEMALDARLTRLLTAGGFRSEHCDQLLVISEAAIPPERREIFSRHGFRDDGPDLGATV